MFCYSAIQKRTVTPDPIPESAHVRGTGCRNAQNDTNSSRRAKYSRNPAQNRSALGRWTAHGALVAAARGTMPASVTIVMTCVGQLLAVFRQIRTTHAVKLEPLTKIFSLDADGDGQVSESEYVLFMLAETREVDMAVIAGLKEQFRALDHDKSGGLSREDFPSVLEVQTTSVVYENTIQSVAWKVIPKKSQDKTRISAEEVPARLEPAHGIHLASTAAVKTKPQPLPQVPRSPPRNEPTTVSPIHAKRGVKFNQPSPPRLSRNSSEHSFLSVDLKASNAHQLSEAGGRLWV